MACHNLGDSSWSGEHHHIRCNGNPAVVSEHNIRVRWERWSPWTATSVRVSHGEAPGPKNRLNWPSRLGVCIGLTTHYCKNMTVTETATNIPNNNLVEREPSFTETMTCTGETHQEASTSKTLLTTKTKTRIGTWNIRTLFEASRCAQVNREMHRYNLKILGLCETRWTQSGKTTLSSGDTLLYSGQEDGQPHMYRVGLMMTPDVTQSLLSWTPVSPRILTARLNSNARNVTIIQCYAPTNIAHSNDKEEFYDQLQAIIDNVPKRDMKILVGT